MSTGNESGSRLPESIQVAIQDSTMEQLAFMRLVSFLSPTEAQSMVAWLHHASKAQFAGRDDLELTRLTQAAAVLLPQTYILIVEMINASADVSFKMLCSLTDADLSTLTPSERMNMATHVLARGAREEDAPLQHMAARLLTERMPDELASLQQPPTMRDSIRYAEDFLRGRQ